MPQLTIERLSLRLSGLSEGDSRHLAQLIGEGLAEALGISGNRKAMQVGINASADSSVQELSDQIVAELVRQLARSV
jgi:hypothetical protein